MNSFLYDVEALYEQTKKVIRGTLITFDYSFKGDFGDNFIFTCRDCGLAFDAPVKMGVVKAHHEAEHPNTDFVLDIVWIGEGLPPKPKKMGK